MESEPLPPHDDFPEIGPHSRQVHNWEDFVHGSKIANNVIYVGQVEPQEHGDNPLVDNEQSSVTLPREKRGGFIAGATTGIMSLVLTLGWSVYNSVNHGTSSPVDHSTSTSHTAKTPDISPIIKPEMQVYAAEADAIHQLLPSELEELSTKSGQPIEYTGANDLVRDPGAPREKMVIKLRVNPETGKTEVTFVDFSIINPDARRDIILATPQGTHDAAGALKALGMKTPNEGESVAAERLILKNKSPMYYSTANAENFAHEGSKPPVIATANAITSAATKYAQYFGREFVPLQDRNKLQKLLYKVTHHRSLQNAGSEKLSRSLKNSGVIWRRKSV